MDSVSGSDGGTDGIADERFRRHCGSAQRQRATSRVVGHPDDRAGGVGVRGGELHGFRGLRARSPAASARVPEPEERAAEPRHVQPGVPLARPERLRESVLGVSGRPRVGGRGRAGDRREDAAALLRPGGRALAAPRGDGLRLGQPRGDRPAGGRAGGESRSSPRGRCWRRSRWMASSSRPMRSTLRSRPPGSCGDAAATICSR